MSLPFRLEFQHPDGRWFTLAGDQDHSMRYLEGYATAYAERSPRLAVRLVRDRDGKVLREWPASDSPEIGMVAGWPTAGQCIRAARKALTAGWESCSLEPTDDERARIEGALRALGPE